VALACKAMIKQGVDAAPPWRRRVCRVHFEECPQAPSGFFEAAALLHRRSEPLGKMSRQVSAVTVRVPLVGQQDGAVVRPVAQATPDRLIQRPGRIVRNT